VRLWQAWRKGGSVRAPPDRTSHRIGALARRHLMKTLQTLTLLLLATGPALAQLPPARTGKLLVGDFQNDRVCVYDESGAFLHDFTAPGLNGPRGIAFLPDGRFIVASELSDELFLFARGERFLGSFGHALLDGPTGMALGPGGNVLFVSSFENGRVLVFDLAGGYLGQLNAPNLAHPNCVAFDSAGNAFVSSASRDSIFAFDAQGVFQQEFTAPGNLLDSPMGIARAANDCLYVAGGNSHNIVKFTTAGAYLGQLTHPDLTGPQGIAIDERGHLFSSSYFLDRLVEFDSGGAYVRTITAGALDTPRSLAFVPLARRWRDVQGHVPAPVSR